MRSKLKIINPAKSSVWGDIFAMSLGVFAAFVLTVFFFQEFDVEEPPLKAVAEVEKEKEQGAILELEMREIGAVYASLGQDDLNFIEFTLSPEIDSKLKELNVSLDGFARPRDVENLQLYMDGKFLDEVGFTGGEGKFDKLNIALQAGEKREFTIKGKINSEAVSGDSFRLGFEHKDSVVVVDEDIDRIEVPAIPIWGTRVRIIGVKKVN